MPSAAANKPRPYNHEFMFRLVEVGGLSTHMATQQGRMRRQEGLVYSSEEAWAALLHLACAPGLIPLQPCT